MRDAKPFETEIAFDDNGAASVVFGHYDQNIAAIERKLGVIATANGNHVVIKGPDQFNEPTPNALRPGLQQAAPSIIGVGIQSAAATPATGD